MADLWQWIFCSGGLCPPTATTGRRLVAVLAMLVPQVGAVSDPIAKAGMVGGIIGGLIGGVIGLVFPILLLIFMRKPKAVAACCK